MRRWVGFAGLLVLFLPGCGSSDGSPPVASERVFSFVVLADPHVGGESDPANRLQACADWVVANAEAEGIDLLFVVGDLGSRRDQVKAVLDLLPVPWVPLIGDNDDEVAFDGTFAPHYAALATRLPGFRRAPIPVVPPGSGPPLYLQNFAFDHRGVRFVGLDWCTRTGTGLDAEQAELFDFAGGTLPWLASELADLPSERLESVVMLSHHPMHSLVGGAGAFSSGELSAVNEVTGPHGAEVALDLAGHYHFEWHDDVGAGGFEVYALDATHEDENSLYVVRVLDDGTRLRHSVVQVVVGG